jgi:hypothetical protein
VKYTILESSVGSDGGLTSTTQMKQRSALGADGAVCGRVIQRANGTPHLIIVLTNLDGQCPLSYSRTNLLNRKILLNSLPELQAMYARCGHHQGVAVSPVQFSEPGVEVSPHRDQLEIVAQVTQLDLTPHTARSHPCPSFQFGARQVGYEDVAGIFTPGHGNHLQTLRLFRREVL